MAACLTAHKPGKPEPAEPGNPAGRSVGPQAGPYPSFSHLPFSTDEITIKEEDCETEQQQQKEIEKKIEESLEKSRNWDRGVDSHSQEFMMGKISSRNSPRRHLAWVKLWEIQNET